MTTGRHGIHLIWRALGCRVRCFCCNRRQFLHSAEKVLTGRSVEEVCYLLFLQTETPCRGGRECMREVFFVQRRIPASILACGWRLHSLNSVLLKAADVCLDPNYRLFTIPFFTSWQLTTSDRRQPRFNTIVAIKFFSLIFHCCGKSFISPSESQDVFGNKSTGQISGCSPAPCCSSRSLQVLSLQVYSVLPHSRAGANICGLSMFIQRFRTNHSYCRDVACQVATKS